MRVRCAACSRPRSADAVACRCGVASVATEPPEVFGTLESRLGIDPDIVRPDAQLTQTFGGGLPAPPSVPTGARLLRRLRHWTEVEWSGPTVPEDLRWGAVLILHYRGPLSGPPPSPAPHLLQVREVRDGTPGLFEALLANPPPELISFELHTGMRDFEALIARGRALPALEYLVTHFREGAPALVLTDALLERHDWLDRLPGDGSTVVFRLRRSGVAGPHQVEP